MIRADRRSVDCKPEPRAAKDAQRDGTGASGTADGFEYDKNAQLTKFRLNGTLSSGAVTGGTVTSYTMDASGNRTNAGGLSYVSDNLNQYTNINGLQVSHGSNGNLGSYNSWYYTYDAMNRLTNVIGPGGVVANFFYDGLGRQIAYNTGSGSTTTLSVWDGWNLAAAYASGSNTPLIRCVYAGNDLIRTTWPQLMYYYADAQGSTTHTASSSGTLLERYTYDPYGKPTFYTPGGTLLPNGSAYGVELLYTGQDWYSQLGLYYLRHCFYRADWGRFLQPDPIGFAGDPANLYRYGANNPVNASDVMGLSGTLVLNANPTPDGVGHAWLTFISDDTGSWSMVGLYPSQGSQQATYPYYGDVWRSTWIDNDAEARLNSYYDQFHPWTGPYANCASFAANGWVSATGEAVTSRPTGLFSIFSYVLTLAKSIIAANGGHDSGYLSPSSGGAHVNPARTALDSVPCKSQLSG